MEQTISLIASPIKFVLNQFKEIIKLGITLAIFITLLFSLSYPLTLIDNYFSSNSTYKKITANIGKFSSNVFKTFGCAIAPGLCISFEKLSANLKEESLLQKNMRNNANNSEKKPNGLYVK